MNPLSILQFTVILCLTLITASLSAQSESTLITNIIPKHAIYKINGEVYEAGMTNKLTLPAGTYEIRIWAKEFNEFIDTVRVNSDKPTVYNLGLKQQSVAFMEHREAMRAYRDERARWGISLAFLTGVSIGATYGAVTSFKKSESERLIDQAEIANIAIRESIVSTTLEEASKDYDEVRDEYDKQRKQQNIMTALSIVSWTATAYYLYRRIRKEKEPKPVFRVKNPFTGELVDLPENMKGSLNTLVGFSGGGIVITF